MLIAKINNGSIVEIGDYQKLFPNTSFPVSGPNEQFMKDENCLFVSNTKPYNEIIEKLSPTNPYIDGDKVYIVVVETLSVEEKEERTNVQWEIVRSRRDSLLQNCDWTQLQDVPLDEQTKQKWVVYRQMLRDVTKQTDPYNIIWPEMPK